MTSRTAILAHVRASLGISPRTDPRGATVAARLADRPRHLIPERAAKPRTALLAQFRDFLRAQPADVIEAASNEAVPEAIAEALRAADLPPRVRMGRDPVLAAMPWERAASLERRFGPAEPADEVGLSRALAGVSETGTLVLASGADNPVTLAFLPPVHVVVVAEADIVGCYEDAFAIVRKSFGARQMPRTLNLVSGPSRTADIGGRIVIGAHGPRRLVVVIVGEPAPPGA
ncbi:MAG: LUD domain-containing protein [Pseudomonadota bacterium]